MGTVVYRQLDQVEAVSTALCLVVCCIDSNNGDPLAQDKEG